MPSNPALAYQAILFDCDGVIVDTEVLSTQLLQQALGELGLVLSNQEMQQHFAGFSNVRNLQTAQTMLGKALPADFAEGIKQRFHQAIEHSLEPIAGVLPLLAKITVPIAMATNARREEMEYKLHKVQLAQRFSVRFCIDDVEHPKPAPDLYLKAASTLGVAAEHCLVIEDSLAGIQAGASAGMRVLAYCQTMDPQAQLDAGAIACFPSIEELAVLLNL